VDLAFPFRGQNIVDEDKQTYLARRYYEESFKLQQLHRLRVERIPEPFDDALLRLQKAIVDAFYLRIQALQDVSENPQNPSDKRTEIGRANFSNAHPYDANSEALNHLQEILETQECLKKRLNLLRSKLKDQRMVLEIQLADIKSYLSQAKRN
jgi:hypothetical protein